MYIYRGELEHRCEECGKTFRFPSELRKHIQLHSDEKKISLYECQVCGERFHQQLSLSAHIIVQHEGGSEQYDVISPPRQQNTHENENVENNGPAPKDNIRHSAEKLDEDTVRMAINNLFAQDHLEPNRVRK